MRINDLILLKNALKDTKIGKMSNAGLREYLKVSMILSKYRKEFDEKQRELINDTLALKGYEAQNITPEQDREVVSVIAPILDEYLLREVDEQTKVLSWEDLCSGILNVPENDKLTIDAKTMITEFLCKEEL